MKLSKETIGTRAVRVWSGGESSPLLYLHGFEQHPGDAPFLNRLAQTFSVKAPEHPGFGGSAGLDTIHDLLDLTLHLRRLVEQWGMGPVDVVGHSLGGMFAAELAVIAPHLVRRLVLVNAYGLWLDDAPLPDPFVMTPDALAAAKWHDRASAGREPSAFDPATDGSAQTFRTINLAAATKFMWPIPDRGLVRRAGYIRAPALVIHGASDGLIPLAHAAALARVIPGAELVKLQGAGHLPMIEAEDAFVGTVGGFLSDRSGAS
jgi:pimeloyl-ACP methyl ester carboxylesterase